MTCYQHNCNNAGTVEVQVSASNSKGDDLDAVTVMMCEECAFPFMPASQFAARFMGEQG